MTTVLRADPATLPSTLKEAVVDSLLTLTYAQVSGAGPSGKFLYGARPRALLNSGFLLPQRNPDGDDEVTSPIWISSHGLQMQLTDSRDAVIGILPRVSVYVRVLPREEDLNRPNCRPAFLLREHILDEIKAERDRRLDEEWKKHADKYPSRWKHPGWRAIHDQMIKEIYAERGIPQDVVAIEATPDVTAEAVAGDVSADGTVADPGETTTEGVSIAAGAVLPPLKDEHFEPLSVPHKWMRLEVELPRLELDISKSAEEQQLAVDHHAQRMNAALAEQLEAWARSTDPEWGGQAWGYRRRRTIPASQYRRWSEFLAEVRRTDPRVALPNIDLEWDLQTTSDWLDPTKRDFFIALENTSKIPKQYVNDTDEAVFQVSLRVDLPASLHHSLKLERIQPSYRYNAYLAYPALGYNCGVAVVQGTGDRHVLETTWTPRYTQPRIVPTSVEGVRRHVRSLAAPDSLDGLKPIVPAMTAWLDGLPARINPAAGLAPTDTVAIQREQEAFKDDLRKWAAEREAVAAGLACLEESRAAWSSRGPQANAKGVVYEAWLGMNEAMADFMRARFGNDNAEWRLFQLAFIVANLPALASRVPEFRHFFDERRDDAVTLLYFATGGGKSEAFFGLLVFNLLLDRLRGKHRGVTALIRYPLRLLTIQQAQRCARVLANAEGVRRRHGYGGEPLAIGFWVGSGGSPNRHNQKGVDNIPDIAKHPPEPDKEMLLREQDPKYAAGLRAWRKLPRCPFCGKETALRRFIAHGDQTLGHVCTDYHCASNEGAWQPLPFYIVDEEIYAIAPSVLLGTVDKLALIGHSGGTIRRVLGMFGAAPWMNPDNGRLYIPDAAELGAGPHSEGMEGVYPAYEHGQRIFHDPFPSLIIQDEAHLLDESLGTFAGLFESTLDAIFEYMAKPLSRLVATDESGTRRRAKVIAASATVADPERQLEHLYQRSIPAMQFPQPGPTLYESFYAKPEEAAASETARRAITDPEVSSRQARVYAAFMTNGAPHTTTSVAVLSSFHFTITRLFDGLTSSDPSKVDAIKDLLAEHASPGPLQSLFVQAVYAADASQLATLLDLHRIALTYVTNKKGGDQIMAAEAEETRKRHVNAGIELDGIDTRLITGSVDQGEIQNVVDTAQDRPAPCEPLSAPRELLRSVIATSAISHGVDVDEFNSMFFAGMPADIAEYIQASSRVGRTHTGFIVLIPTPQRRRDRHIIHVFDIFHRFLERMVQPAAIDRWAEKALDRAFPSMFQAYLLGVVPSRKLMELPETEKNRTPNFANIRNVNKEFQTRGDAFLGEINQFVELAMGLRDGFAPEGSDHYRHRIDDRTRRLIVNVWSSPLYDKGMIEGYFRMQADPMMKPMTSLRDVDQGGIIRASFRDAGGRKQDHDDVRAVMDLVRHGVSGDDSEDSP